MAPGTTDKKDDARPDPMAEQCAPKGIDRKLPENSKAELDERLDEGVEESFPASDPVSVKITK